MSATKISIEPRMNKAKLYSYTYFIIDVETPRPDWVGNSPVHEMCEEEEEGSDLEEVWLQG